MAEPFHWIFLYIVCRKRAMLRFVLWNYACGRMSKQVQVRIKDWIVETVQIYIYDLYTYRAKRKKKKKKSQLTKGVWIEIKKEQNGFSTD